MKELERELSGIDAVLQGGGSAEVPAGRGESNEEYIRRRREELSRQLNSKGGLEMDMMDRTPEINSRIRMETTGKPRLGQNVDGYIFLGGDPSDQNNWDKE
jgi:hypothetical protein